MGDESATLLLVREIIKFLYYISDITYQRRNPSTPLWAIFNDITN